VIVKDGYREPTSSRVYVPTGKEPASGSYGEEAYWVLAGRIESTLGPEGGTIGEIYHEVTGPLGLTLDDTRLLVREAVRRGYLK